jgi:hypothetical protein
MPGPKLKLVHFINGLFDAQYPLDSPVTFAATESVSPQDDHLAGIRSDMLLTVAGDAFLIEAQIDNDENMACGFFRTPWATPKRLRCSSSLAALLPVSAAGLRFLCFIWSGG